MNQTQESESPGASQEKARQDNGCAKAKSSFDNIYDAPTPVPYFSALKPLDYRTPQHAQPVIRRALSAIRRLRHRDSLQILDLCSGYGVNGALAKHEIGLDRLYRRYANGNHGVTVTGEADRAAFARFRRPDGEAPRVIGQDVAGNALAYAEAAGFIDGRLQLDLENEQLSLRQARMLAETDLITITGGLSYIGEKTLSRVLRACHSRPWVLFYPLRGTPLEEIEESLSDAGLWLERWRKPFAHRRFADGRERRATLVAMAEQPYDGCGPVSQTHQETVLHLARPEEESDAVPLADLVLGRFRAAGEVGQPAFES